jgi:hypothetical protein
MEQEFEVKGHDEHVMEHKAHGGDDLAMRIAVMTAVLSTIGAVFSYQGASSENAAAMLKNEAVLKKTEAADQWAFYQAKSQKQMIAESMAELVPDAEKAAKLKEKAERYGKEKEEIKSHAEKLDEESKQLSEESEHKLHPHHLIARGMTLIQVGIALSSVAALTRRKWLVIIALASAVTGLVIGGTGLVA